MTKEEISQWLRANLNSASWNLLQTSFVGQELIEWASLVLYVSEQQRNSIQDNQYPDTADLKSMLLMAFSRDIPLDLHKPSYIKINNVFPKGVISPYTAMLSSTTLTRFYNHEFLVPGKESICYQGTAHTIYKELLYDAQGIDRKAYNYFYDVQDKIHFFKLGLLAISDTVIVFKQLTDGSVIPVSPYDVLRESPDAEMFKLKRNTDNSLNVYFGDGRWAKPLDPSLNYQIIWVDATFNQFDRQAFQMTVNSVNYTFEITGWSIGKENDISYTRDQLRHSIVKRSVAATQSQIESFVRKYETIHDCRVDTSQAPDNVVTTYVKPIDLAIETFDDIVDGLNLHGEVVTKYNVVKGKPLYYTIRLAKLAAITEQIKQQVTKLVEAEFAYLNQPYVSAVSSARVNELISPLTAGAVLAALAFHVEVDAATQVVTLPTRPVKGSLEIYRNGNYCGWDSEGFIYAALVAVEQYPELFARVGEYFLNISDSSVWVYNNTLTIGSNNTETLPLKGAYEINYLKEERRFLALYNDRFEVYNANEAFDDEAYSVIKNAYVFIKPILTVNQKLEKFYCYKHNQGVYQIIKDGEEFYLRKYAIVGNELIMNRGYSVFLFRGESPLFASFYNDTSLLVFTDSSKIYYVADIINPDAAVELSYDFKMDIDFNDILFLGVDNGFYLMTKALDQEEFVYTLRRSSGFDIEISSVSRFLLKTDFVTLYEESTDENKDYTLMFTTDEGYYVRDNGTELHNYIYKITQTEQKQFFYPGYPIPTVGRVGIASYFNKELQFDEMVNDIQVWYESADVLEKLDIDTFPVMEAVEWIDD